MSYHKHNIRQFLPEKRLEIAKEMAQQSKGSVAIDECDITPSEKELLISMGIVLKHREPHPRYGSYKWGYYHMPIEIAECIDIPEKYWSLKIS